MILKSNAVQCDIHISQVNLPFFLQRFKHKQSTASPNCQAVELLIIVNHYVVFFRCKALPQETLSILEEVLKDSCDKEQSVISLTEWKDNL